MRRPEDETMRLQGIDAAAARGSSVARRLNVAVQELIDQVDPLHQWTWPFLCECDDPACSGCVVLASDSFDARLRDQAPLLAADHPVARARAARAEARNLRSDATALRAQAEHQVRRRRRIDG